MASNKLSYFWGEGNLPLNPNIWRFAHSESGRYLVAYKSGFENFLLQTLSPNLSTFVVSDEGKLEREYDVILMPAIAVAVVTERAVSLMRSAAAEVEEFLIAIEPEGTKRAIGLQYPVQRQFRSASSGSAWDESKYTWGLQAIGCCSTSLSGKGIRTAILDTGVDLSHPDLGPRILRHHTESFIPGQAAIDDIAHHGTHCVGTLGGPLCPEVAPRYGVAYESELWIGKVLGDDGNGQDSWILAGMHWAVRHRCQIISMSLGTPVSNLEPYSKVYEAAAHCALTHGTLVIAAAGNDSSRYLGRICPVSSPANCPSVLAVGALDSIEQNNYTIADFSNSGINPNGGSVDIAAPGVFIYSSYPLPIRYAREAGTSMATPHVAGIAALLLQENPTRGPKEIWQLLAERSKSLSIPAADVGAGLVSL
jgi:subtilisin